MTNESKPAPEEKSKPDTKPSKGTKSSAKKKVSPPNWKVVIPQRDADGYLLIAEDPDKLSGYRLSKDGKAPAGIPDNWSKALAEFVDDPDPITLKLWRYGIRKPVNINHEIRQFVRAMASRYYAHAKVGSVVVFEQKIIAVIEKD